MSDTGLFADFLDLELFAKEVDRDPRTVRRWLASSRTVFPIPASVIAS